MQLLVSVRSEDEAREALAAGADILDAKEPAAGALGEVAPEVLAGIASLLPPHAALSVALGEPEDVAALAAIVAARASVLAARATFLKFVPPDLETDVAGHMTACLRAAVPSARLIVAGYADRLGEAGLEALVRAAAAAGAAGVLLDTERKDAPLLDVLSSAAIDRFVTRAHRAGLLAALAGSLALADLARVAALGADVAGVRGAACDGGRAGRLSARRVRALVRSARLPPPVPAAPTW